MEFLTKDRTINISGVCVDCNNKKDCDFVKEVKSFIRNKLFLYNVTDSEICVYACDDFEHTEDTRYTDSSEASSNC